MKISLKVAFLTVIMLASVLPIQAMNDDNVFYALPENVLDQIANSYDLCTCGDEACANSNPVLSLQDIWHVQKTCSRFYKNFKAPNKVIVIDFLRNRGENESAQDFINRVTARLAHVAKYHHNNKIVLALSSNRLAEALPGDNPPLAQLFSTIKDLGLADRICDVELANNWLHNIPATLAGLNNLQILNLGGNNLDLSAAAVERVCTISSLTNLNLDGNHLQFLPDSIGSMQNLETLDLSENNFTSVNQELSKLAPLRSKLKELTIANSRLEAIPPVLLTFQNLHFLDLGENELPAQELLKLKCLKQIKTLVLENMHLEQISDLLFALPQLEELDLSGNQIDATELKRIFAIKTLKRLELNNMNLYTIPVEIRALPHLHSLSLAENHLTSEELEKVCCSKDLTSLAVSGMHLETLPEAIRNLQRLKSLEAWESGFNPETAAHIKSLLPADCKFLTEAIEADF